MDPLKRLLVCSDGDIRAKVAKESGASDELGYLLPGGEIESGLVTRCILDHDTLKTFHSRVTF